MKKISYSSGVFAKWQQYQITSNKKVS